MRVQIPCLPLVNDGVVRLDGERDDHSLLLTRRSGFESWSGHIQGNDNIYGVCGVAVSAQLVVNQKVPVRLRSDTLFVMTKELNDGSQDAPAPSADSEP